MPVTGRDDDRLIRPGDPMPGTSDRPVDALPATSQHDAGRSIDGSRYLWVGRRAWATIGIAGALVLAGFVVGQLSLIVIPVVLALFPAALLLPLAQLFKRIRLPAALASILTILVLLGGLTGIVAGVTVLVQGELEDLQESLGEGIGELEQTIQDDPLGLGYDFPGFAALGETARENLFGGGGGGDEAGEEGGEAQGAELAAGPLAAATAVTEGLTGLVLLFVALFFYLKDEGRLSQGVIATLPRTWQRHATEIAARFWGTVGRYFRGQIVVALVDAVFIGIGLLLLGVPLALPLAVLVFFGALFPIVGSFVAGGVAVLVAFADAGVVTAVLVLVLIIAVQQIEGNVLEPLILSNAIALHPLVIILALTAGTILFGIVGAFLAVPVAAGFARALDYARTELGREGLVLPDLEPPPAEAAAKDG